MTRDNFKLKIKLFYIRNTQISITCLLNPYTRSLLQVITLMICDSKNASFPELGDICTNQQFIRTID